MFSELEHHIHHTGELRRALSKIWDYTYGTKSEQRVRLKNPAGMISPVMQFITFGEVRLGEFLVTHLADPQWTSFRAAVAYVKRSRVIAIDRFPERLQMAKAGDARAVNYEERNTFRCPLGSDRWP